MNITALQRFLESEDASLLSLGPTALAVFAVLWFVSFDELQILPDVG